MHYNSIIWKDSKRQTSPLEHAEPSNHPLKLWQSRNRSNLWIGSSCFHTHMDVSLNGGTPKTPPKASFLVGTPMVVGYHHFRRTPYILYTHILCWFRMTLFWNPDLWMVPLQAARLFNQICDAVRYLHTEKQLVWSSVEELLSESRIIPMSQGNCGIAVVLFLFCY